MHNPAGFVLLTDQKYIDDFLNTFKTDKDVDDNARLQEYFGHKIVRGENKTITQVKPPKYYITDEFILKKDTLPNVKKDMQVSIGAYIFNLFCIVPIFGDKIDFINERLTPDVISNLHQTVSDLLLDDKVTGEDFGELQNRLLWISYRGTLWSPGPSFEFGKINPAVAKAKSELLKKWKDELAKGYLDPVASYVAMVEKPLLEIARENLKHDEAWPLYERGGKPKFGNVYKNCTISMGPVFDPITGEYKIAENSFMDGVDNNLVPVFANIQVDAAYNRAVHTQDGGAKSKLVFAALQTIRLGPKGSNCGSKRYIVKKITKKNLHKNLYRYIIDEEQKKIVQLTMDNWKKFENKMVKMRSPMFCTNTDICNVCAGDYFYKLGLSNVGNTTSRITSMLMNKALKAMHDISVSADFIDPFKYFQVLK